LVWALSGDSKTAAERDLREGLGEGEMEELSSSVLALCNPVLHGLSLSIPLREPELSGVPGWERAWWREGRGGVGEEGRERPLEGREGDPRLDLRGVEVGIREGAAEMEGAGVTSGLVESSSPRLRLPLRSPPGRDKESDWDFSLRLFLLSFSLPLSIPPPSTESRFPVDLDFRRALPMSATVRKGPLRSPSEGAELLS
jgi:hypothetical protein